MHKIPKKLIQQIVSTLALAIHPNKSYLEVNQLIQEINSLEEIKENA